MGNAAAAFHGIDEVERGKMSILVQYTAHTTFAKFEASDAMILYL